MKEETHTMCPKFENAFSLLGKRWTGLIINVLLDGPKRFKEIAGEITQMSDRVLVERLKELEESGIVVREVYPETPVRIEYVLTEKGKGLEKVMLQVQDWAETWIELEPETVN
ncbi:winged helix-turn-helix transcriptional regulator [Listeria booriae]|uniref:winged helix-turn-helix transcriptional regulator n=1 Tax=Listeria booriae TaxID=1552123 RepID=UPI001623BC40|nr:helix-turn-helix domain-containing protein [Listeria booriae]MBC1505049.1 helix-turn-helix transcriptional regulator [Listeria booriae]